MSKKDKIIKFISQVFKTLIIAFLMMIFWNTSIHPMFGAAKVEYVQMLCLIFFFRFTLWEIQKMFKD